ncbi:Mediator of RNA polymerase II transcription subunita [Sesamum alatum]|uniref:Mediator of RNA polymerase II transcription subunit 20 n=1 Tax=Sesamum alatum TaxID=300844 RepID=A0AAE1XPL7_9LAMI|nr:Mediator of RNA polymerase II transcription subunita [Sesamum alatum]
MCRHLPLFPASLPRPSKMAHPLHSQRGNRLEGIIIPAIKNSGSHLRKFREVEALANSVTDNQRRGVPNHHLPHSEVSQCAESINGVKEGRWKSTLSFYKAIAREQTIGNDFPRDFVGISLAEQPNKYFLVIRGQRPVAEAESSI